MSTIKALVVPRASVAQAIRSREELKRTGVYILTGADPDSPGRTRIYVGEGDAVAVRISAHTKDQTKDFWEEVIVFISKDENLTKAHVRYVEARLIQLARDARRVSVANGTAPLEKGKLPEADGIEMEEFIGQARILLGTLGYEFFDTTAREMSPDVQDDTDDSIPAQDHRRLHLRLSGEGYAAECEVDPASGQFIVKKGSRFRKETVPSMAKTYSELRQELIDSGILSEENNQLLLMQDYPFSSASGAAQIVAGFSVNGRAVWKTDSGQPYAEWEDAQLMPEQVAE